MEDLNNEVHGVGKWKRNQTNLGTKRNFISHCKYCGGEHGWKKEYCPAFGKICEHCGKRNHFAAICLQRKHAGKRDNTTKPHVNAVSNTYDQGDGIVSHNALRTIHTIRVAHLNFDQLEVLHERERRSCDVGLKQRKLCKMSIRRS